MYNIDSNSFNIDTMMINFITLDQIGNCVDNDIKETKECGLGVVWWATMTTWGGVIFHSRENENAVSLMQKQ